MEIVWWVGVVGGGSGWGIVMWGCEVHNTGRTIRNLYISFIHRFIKNLNYYFLKPLCLMRWGVQLVKKSPANTSTNEA